LLLLSGTIYVGAIFANRIAKPIKRLVNATEKVQSGDLTVNIPVSKDKEDEISILTSAFNKMVRRIDIQQKDLALAQRTMAWKDVASRVAHEIKNPLTPISLSADRLRKKFIDEISDEESYIKYITTIQRHTKDIQNIISEFAEFAKLPSPVFQKVEIIAKLKDLIESRQMIDETIIYHFSSNTERFYFRCDPTQINQIIINLLKNAEEALENIKHHKKINLDVNLEESELEIFVSDNGKGFPNDLIDRITEPYLTTRSKGTGLGLAIVKKIAQDHNGDVVISNDENGGARVKLIFNLQKYDENIK